MRKCAKSAAFSRECNDQVHKKITQLGGSMQRKVPILLLLLLFMAGSIVSVAATEFSFTDLAGKAYSSPAMKGSPLVIYVGSTS